jgi:hypothetical protein
LLAAILSIAAARANSSQNWRHGNEAPPQTDEVYQLARVV